MLSGFKAILGGPVGLLNRTLDRRISGNVSCAINTCFKPYTSTVQTQVFFAVYDQVEDGCGCKTSLLCPLVDIHL